MKKFFKTVAIGLLVLSSFSANNVSASNEVNYTEHEQLIESFIYTFDHEEVEATFFKKLKDVFGNESFLLFNLSNGGYAVITKENMAISEISPRSLNDFVNINDISYYLGAGRLLTESEFSATMISTVNSNNATAESIDSIMKNTESILNENPLEFIETKSGTGDYVLTKPINGTEYGISSSHTLIRDFAKEKWENNSTNFGDLVYFFNGICGSIAASMLITFYDYEYDDNLIDEEYSHMNSNYPYWIVSQMVDYVDGSFSGALATEIVTGINNFIEDNCGSQYTATYTYAVNTVKSKLKDEYPVIVNTGFDENPYGLHYMLAFSYVSNSEELWYHAADNHGHLAWVNDAWAEFFVYLK